MLKDFAVGPFVLDFTNSAFEEKPAGGSTFARLVASITVLPSKPCTLSRASAIAPPGTATTTASTFETSPPSRPILVTSWPSLSQRSASPPPTLPLPTTAIFIALLPRFSRYHKSIEFRGIYLLNLPENLRHYARLSISHGDQPHNPNRIQDEHQQRIYAHAQDTTARPKDEPIEVDGREQRPKPCQVDVSALGLWQRSLTGKQTR